MQAGLAGTVCECLEGGNTEAINAADIDNARGVIWCGRLFQKRRNKLGQVEDTVQVEGKDSSEGLGWVLVVGSTPVGARVVHEDMQFCRGTIALAAV